MGSKWSILCQGFNKTRGLHGDCLRGALRSQPPHSQPPRDLRGREAGSPALGSNNSVKSEEARGKNKSDPVSYIPTKLGRRGYMSARTSSAKYFRGTSVRTSVRTSVYVRTDVRMDVRKVRYVRIRTSRWTSVGGSAPRPPRERLSLSVVLYRSPV